VRTISVRLDDGSEARLNNLCQTLGISQSEVVKAGLVLLQQSISRGRDHAALLRQKLRDQHMRERQVGPQP
jgi:Arc/MetJ-type ribon-helix-helix transcriptional regulator